MSKRILNRIVLSIVTLLLCISLIACAEVKEDTKKEDTTKEDTTKEEGNVDGSNDEAAEETVDKNTLVFTGVGTEEIKFTLEEVKAFEPIQEIIQSSTSSGEIKTADIKGVKLATLLESKGISAKGYKSIRIVASDGYEIAVPKEVIEQREIIIAYEQDGEAYDGEFGCFRTVVPDERAMYWVRGTVNLDFEMDETIQSDIEKIVILENVAEQVGLEDYTYYENVDKAVHIAKIMEKFVSLGDAKSGKLIASDGLETEQTVEIIQNGYLKMTGENTPLFIAPEMPKGMQVKGVKYLKVGNTCLVSMESLMKESKEVQLQSILKDLGMVEGTYSAISNEGNITLEGATLNDTKLMKEENAYYLINDKESIKIKVQEIVQK